MVLLADGFEGGRLSSRWSRIVHEAGATVRVVRAPGRPQHRAMELTVRASRGSRGYLELRMPHPAALVTVRESFYVHAQGDRGSNVPIARLFLGGIRMLDIYRENGRGRLWLRTNDGSGGWHYEATRAILQLDRWYDVTLTARAVEDDSLAIVTIDGEVLRAGVVDLPTSSFDRVLVGAEHVDQEMDLFVDGVQVTALVSSQHGRGLLAR